MTDDGSFTYVPGEGGACHRYLFFSKMYQNINQFSWAMVQYGRASLADCIQRLRRRTPQKIIHKIMVQIVWIFLFFFFQYHTTFRWPVGLRQSLLFLPCPVIYY